MNIESAIYNIDTETRKVLNIITVIDGVESFVPVDSVNRHYAAIMEKVDAGTLTIEPLYTEQELDQMEADAAAAEEAKAAATAETEAKLEALGLTKEDLAALLGS